MRLATWNVNSLRARVDRVIAFLQRSNTDVLAMQEIKCKPEQFPREPFEQAGYHVEMLGFNQWNGVAVASRFPIVDVQTGFAGQPTWKDVVEARALGVTVDTAGGPSDVQPSKRLENGQEALDLTAPTLNASQEANAAGTPNPLTVWSLYIPNGREIDNPHYQYKLEWLAALRQAARVWIEPEQARVVLVGDWNVAPTDTDVWDPKFFEGRTHVTPAERAAFSAFAQDGWTEVTRDLVTNYTFWDYQQLRFPRNEGMRIDYVYASPMLAKSVKAAEIDRDERKGKGASDHVPVIVEF